jgi:hypothetical protein
MKKIYLKPTTEEFLINSAPLMITASGDGERIVDDGGSTGENQIIEADSRRRRDIWEDEEVEDDMAW